MMKEKNGLLPWAQRLRQRLNQLQITPAELAEKMRLSECTVYSYLVGRRRPAQEKWHKIAEILHTTPEYLNYGVINDDLKEKIDEQTMSQVILRSLAKKNVTFVTKIDWGLVKFEKDAVKMHVATNIIDNVKRFPMEGLYPDCCYLLEIKDDAMDCENLNLHKNSHILVNPELPSVFKNGDFVVAETAKKEIVFRQYSIINDMPFLIALNKKYIPIQDFKILGHAIKSCKIEIQDL